MKGYRCPVCKKPLTRVEYEKALKIHTAREELFRQREEKLRSRYEVTLQEIRRKEREKAKHQTTGMQATIKKLKEQLRQREKGSTPQTEGLEFEEKLAARLKREFPEDEIQHKGKGGDVIHLVKFARKPAGTIVYECKRTPRIERAHIQQARVAQQSRQADVAVLDTTGQKRRFGGFDHMNGVWIVSPLGVIALASLLRQHLIEMLRAGIGKEQRARIAHQLVKYLTGPQFKNPIEEIVHLGAELQEMVKAEAKDHLHIWKRRLTHYQRIRWNNTQIQQNIQLVLNGKEPKMLAPPKAAPLQLPAPAGQVTIA